jgi:hypothetical protein
VLLAFLLCGCVQKKVSERLEAASQKLLSDQVQYAENRGRPEHILDWNTALRLLEQRNPQLKRGKVRLQDIEKERKNFALRELSPRISAVANLSSALGEIANLSSDSLGIRLLGGIQIPDPLSLYGRRYALELEYYLTKLQYEELVRRTYADLYETFLTQETVDYELSTDPEPEVAPTASNLASALRRRLSEGTDRSEIETARRNGVLQRRINTLLNSPGQNYRLDYETLPELNYPQRFQRLKFRNGFGLLALKQSAGEIESSRAQLQQTRLDRYPSLNVSASLPTLYDSNADSAPEFEDIRLFSGANDSFEFTGREARSLRSAEQRAQFVRDRIQLGLEREASNLKQLKLRYRNYLKEEKLLKRQLAYYKNNPPLGSAELLRNRIDEVGRLRARLFRLRNYRHRLEMEFWVWDEQYWDSPF